LKELEREGIFVSKNIGNQRHYALNKKYPLLKELKKTYNLKYGLERKLTDLLKELNGLQEVYIFGSYAKNSFGPESDIDLLLIGSHSGILAKRKLSQMEKSFKREFNSIDMTEDEFRTRKKKKDEFIVNIFENKIIKII